MLRSHSAHDFTNRGNERSVEDAYQNFEEHYKDLVETKNYLQSDRSFRLVRHLSTTAGELLSKPDILDALRLRD